MNSKLFLDTNIIIDFIEQRPFELEFTNKLFRAAEENIVGLFICESTLINTWYITGLDKQIVRLSPLIHILHAQIDTIEKAFLSSFKDKEDAVLYYTALRNKMNYFITRNKKDYKGHSAPGLLVMSPEEAIKLVKL